MGGGSAGEISYPSYMETLHWSWLDRTGTTSVTNGMVQWMNAAFTSGRNPYATNFSKPGFTARQPYDPTARIANIVDAADAVETKLQQLSTRTNWEDINDTPTNVEIQDFIDDQVAYHQDAADTYTIPAFEAGMRDINAVQSTAFVQGKADIYSKIAQEGTRLNALLMWDARYGQLQNQRLQLMLQATELRLHQIRSNTSFVIEANRLGIVAGKEEADKRIELNYLGATWEMMVLAKYGGTLLGSIAGSGAGIPEGPSTAASALGGALGGAAIGTEINAGWGTAIGAVVGGLAGLLAS